MKIFMHVSTGFQHSMTGTSSNMTRQLDCRAVQSHMQLLLPQPLASDPALSLLLAQMRT